MNSPLPLPRLCLRLGGVGNRMFGEQRGIAEDSSKIQLLLQQACQSVLAEIEHILADVLENDRTAQPLKWPAAPGLCSRTMCRLLGHSDRWNLDALRTQKYVTVFSSDPSLLRVLTGAAEGADLLIEDAAHARSASAATQYQIDRICIGPPNSVPATSLAVGTIPPKFSLVGPPPHPRTDKQLEAENARQRAFAFRAQSEALRHHSDLLLAIWDHDTEAKPGGTWETVQLALAEQIPVIAVLVRGENSIEIKILEQEEQLTSPPPGNRTWQQQLHQVISAMLRFPDRHRGGNPDRSSYHPRAAFLRLCSPQPLHEIWTGRIWKSFHAFTKWLDLRHQTHAANSNPHASGDAPSPAPQPDGTFNTLYEPSRKRASSHGLSGVFGDAYRGGIVASYALAAFAVLLAVLGSICHSLHGPDWCLFLLAAAELLTILIMFAISQTSKTEDWNTAWTESRVLAEALRFMKFLGPIGLHTRLPRLPYYLRGDTATPAPEAMWSVWYFLALIRTAPLRLQPSATNPGEAAKIIQSIIREQIEYHNKNASQKQTLHHWIEHTSFWLFISVLLCVTLHLFDVAFGWHVMAIPGLLVCVSGPTLIAALHGLASHLEITRLRQRSSNVAKLLTEKLKTLEQLEQQQHHPDSAAAAWTVASEALDTTSLLLDETAGWSMLYKNSEIQPG